MSAAICDDLRTKCVLAKPSSGRGLLQGARATHPGRRVYEGKERKKNLKTTNTSSIGVCIWGLTRASSGHYLVLLRLLSPGTEWVKPKRVINPSFYFQVVSPGRHSLQRRWYKGSSWGIQTKIKMGPGWWLLVSSTAPLMLSGRSVQTDAATGVKDCAGSFQRGPPRHMALGSAPSPHLVPAVGRGRNKISIAQIIRQVGLQG